MHFGQHNLRPSSAIHVVTLNAESNEAKGTKERCKCECDVKLSDRKIQFGFQFVIVEAAFLTLENLMTINVMNGEVERIFVAESGNCLRRLYIYKAISKNSELVIECSSIFE